jgi:CRISPR-associated protein Csx10
LYRIGYRIKNHSPVVVTGGGGDQNIVTTEEYIPGNSILGVFAAKYIKKSGKPGELIHEDERFYKWFLKGEIVFGNAYLSIHDGKRILHELLPTPLSIQTDKDNKEIYNLTHYETELIKEKPKPIKGYCQLKGKTIYISAPAKQLNFHHFRKDKTKGHSEKEGIFFYEALAKEQHFTGFIYGLETELQQFKDFYSDDLMPIRIGRSRNVEYGNAEIELGSIEKYAPDLELEGNAITMSFVSPLILINKNGYPEISEGILREYLDEAFGTKKYSIQKLYSRSRNVENYVSVWKLKKPLDKAYDCGTTIRVVFEDGINDDLKNRLANMVLTGIGERLNEGYGRFEINWATNPTYTQMETRSIRIDMPEGLPTGTSRDIFAAIVSKRIKTQIHSMALDIAKECKSTGRISSNLISRLELIVESSCCMDDLRCKMDKLRDTAKKPLNEIYLKSCNKKLMGIIKDGLDFSQVENRLGKVSGFAKRVNIELIKEEDKFELNKYYFNSLFGALRMFNKKHDKDGGEVDG